MSSNEEVEEFLEHFGVKGMHWGIRNDKRRTSSGKNLTPSQRRKRNLNRVHKGMKITAGALFVGALISSGRPKSLPASSLTKNIVRPVFDGSEETHSIAKNAREIFMAQNRQRDGAYQMKKLLKSMGHDVVD